MNNDCAWCGTGNGICDEHMNAMFAESAELAATGKYLAKDSENNNTQAKAEQSQESEAERV